MSEVIVPRVVINYEPSPTGLKIHTAKQQGGVIGVGGPVGTGKSVMMCNELLRTAVTQAPFNGIRKTKFGIVRNTYPELKTTTVATWLRWVPEELGRITYGSPITHTLNFALEDGTTVECTIYFLAMDSDDDVKKLKSFEFTKIWFNEASELQKAFIDAATARLPRFPDKAEGGASEWGVLLDTNMPDEEHWIYDLFEVMRPKGYVFYKQPPAILKVLDEKGEWTGEWVGNPDAENVSNHINGFNYWLDQVPGKDPGYIRVFLEGKYGQTKHGKPVYEYEWNEEHHLNEKELLPDRELPVYTGWDWGLNPACIFGQINRKGKLIILKEVVPDSDCSLESFLDDWIIPFVHEHFRGCRFEGWGDPAGIGRNPLDKSTPFSTCAGKGIIVKPTSTNNFQPRKDAVASFLKRLEGFGLNPSCKKLRLGFNGKYGYPKLGGSNGLYKDKPDKNEFSHPHDGLQYLCLGLTQLSKRRFSGTAKHMGKGVAS